MATPQHAGRETRLLLATIAIAVLMLLVLARLRFPAGSPEVAEPAPAPLERLGAQASYEDLASTMSELGRQVRPSLVTLRIRPERAGGSYVTATRVTADRAVMLLGESESLVAAGEAPPPAVLFRDRRSGVAVISVESAPDRVVTPRTGTPRPGPRYVAVVDATETGTTLRPLYVGATTPVQDPVLQATVFSVAAPTQLVRRGTAVFTLAGTFVGITSGDSGALRILPAELLQAIAQGEPPAPQPESDFGVEVQPLTDPVARVAGADRGVVISDVDPGGPGAGTLQPGDVVQSVDGQPVTSVDEFVALERSRTPGNPVPVAYVRHGATASVPIVAREARPAQPPAAPAPQVHGLTLRNFRGAGIEVAAVARDSAAERAGLQPGDIITSINGQRAASSADLDRAFAALSAGAARGQAGGTTGGDPEDALPRAPAGLLLTIERGAGRRVVALEKR